MPARHFQPAHKPDSAPETQQMVPASGAAFTIGAPLARDGTNPDRVVVHGGGATVTGIIGIAGAAVSAGLPAGKGDLPFGVTIPVYKVAGREVAFIGQVTDGATPVTVAGDGSLIGEFGMVANSNIWTVDAGDETNVVLTVIRELPEINCVLFKFLASAVAD